MRRCDRSICKCIWISLYLRRVCGGSVTSVGMAGAGGADKLSYVNESMSTVFTIIVFHRLILSISQTKKRGIHIVCPHYSGIAKRLKQKNKEIHLPRLSEYEVVPLVRDARIHWQGRASVVLIFVLAILSNESIDNMPFQLCVESKFQHKYSKLSW